MMVWSGRFPCILSKLETRVREYKYLDSLFTTLLVMLTASWEHSNSFFEHLFNHGRAPDVSNLDIWQSKCDVILYPSHAFRLHRSARHRAQTARQIQDRVDFSIW